MIKLSIQGAFSADPSQLNTKTSSQDEHNEASSDVAISDTVTTNGSTEPQSIIINGKKPELVQSLPPTEHTMSLSNSVPPPPPAVVPQLELTHAKTLSQDGHLKVTSTNGSAEPQSVVINNKQPETAETPVPTQHVTNDKAVPVPVPRARTRGHTLQAEAVTSTETNPVQVRPLPTNDQISVLPRSLPRSNTVNEMCLDPLHKFQNGAITVTDDNLCKPNGLATERQRSQTLLRRPPRTIARRNLPKEDSGPTTELQALLAKRRQWEQK